MATEQGFSNQKKKGQAQFKTVHGVGSDSFGTPNIPKYLYDVIPSDQAIVNIDDIIGKDGQVQFWNIEVTAHGAVAGNIIRLVDGSIKGFEFEAISIPDADHIQILPISPLKPSTGDNLRVMAWVTAKSDEEGNLQITQGPVRFVLDSIPTEVSKDSVIPASTIALPVEDYDTRAQLASLNTKDFATETTLVSLEAKDFATETTLNSLLAKTAGSLVPVEYDEVVQTYVGATTDLNTVLFKKLGATVASLTFTYDGSNRLIGVVRS